MAGHERVMFDTSALYALRAETDLFHLRTSVAYRQLMDQHHELWTTSYALVETVALLHRRLGFGVVSEFSEWRESNLRVFWIDGRLHDEAWGRFMAAKGLGLSFVDWTIVIAAREMSAPVFTFDGGFANEGLAVLPR